MDLARKLKGAASLGSGIAVHVSSFESSEHLYPSNCQGGSSLQGVKEEEICIYSRWMCKRAKPPPLRDYTFLPCWRNVQTVSSKWVLLNSRAECEW